MIITTPSRKLLTNIVIILMMLTSYIVEAQYVFETINFIDHTEIKSQDRTGTCWSFSTASFMESELMRKGFGSMDLSEMYVVRNVYIDKAKNYILRQGKANFSQGSLAHDLIKSATLHGIVPEAVYNGKLQQDEKHNHTEMVNGLKGYLDGVLKSKPISTKWMDGFIGILDAYMGKVPQDFMWEGQKFTPISFSNKLRIDMDDYVHITSFNHHSYYNTCILEIPDNYSNGSYYNLPLDEMMQVIDLALSKGYSVTWDGDVSEKGFGRKSGIAIMPTDLKRNDLFENPGDELSPNKDLRQELYNQLKTTDDHLMHIIGSAKDQNGTKYYHIKNSWGKTNPFKGKLYMSDSYTRLKTIAITVHKNALSEIMLDKIKSK